MQDKPLRRTSIKQRLARWWFTSCPYCRRMRAYVAWTLIVFLVYFYVFEQ